MYIYYIFVYMYIYMQIDVHILHFFHQVAFSKRSFLNTGNFVEVS